MKRRSFLRLALTALCGLGIATQGARPATAGDTFGDLETGDDFQCQGEVWRKGRGGTAIHLSNWGKDPTFARFADGVKIKKINRKRD